MLAGTSSCDNRNFHNRVSQFPHSSSILMATSVFRSGIITTFAFGTDDNDGDCFYGSAIHGGKKHTVQMPGFQSFKIFIASRRKMINIKQVLRVIESEINHQVMVWV